MARFTMTIREIRELFEIFDFDYTTPFGVTKEQLEEAFYTRYNEREIAYETYEIWKPKFKYLWLQALSKYDSLFNYTVDVFTNVKSTTIGTQSGETSNTSTMKHMPTPVDSIAQPTDTPASYTTGEGGNQSELEQNTQTTRQNKTDVELIELYRRSHETTLEWFIRELNKVMFKRY